MSVVKGNILSSSPIVPTKNSAKGIWRLSDVRYAQTTDTWPYPTLSDLSSAITALFENNEPGVWYDPSDINTMYQDTTGNTPVTDVEQPVGFWIDKSRGGGLSAEKIINGEFSDGSTGWSLQSGVTVSDGKLTCSSAANIAYQDNVLEVGKIYKVSFYMVKTSGVNIRLSGVSKIEGGTMLWTTTTGTLTAFVKATGTTFGLEADGNVFTGTIDNVSVKEILGNHSYQTGSARPTYSRRYNLLVGTDTLSTQSVTTSAINYTLSFSGAGTVTLSGTATGSYSSGTNTFNASSGTLTLTVSGTVTNAQLVPTHQSSIPYQYVINSTTYDTNPNNFPAYIKSVNFANWMQTTGDIVPGTNKVQFCTGVSTITNGESAMIFSFSSNADSSTGSFSLLGPRTGESTRFKTGGTNKASINTANVSEINGGRFVYTGLGDIAAPSATIRRNGTSWSTTSTQGFGNYLSYPFYIFSGSGVIFSGQCFGIFVRFGPNLTNTQIDAIENYMKQKTGITF